MPELPDPKEIYDDARSFLADMIQGDVAVREAGLALAAGRAVVPALLVCRRIRGKLRFVLRVSRTKKFVLGLFEKKREDEIANLRVYLQIEPVIETEPTTGVPRSTYVGPDFLVENGDPKSFLLRLTDGGVYETELDTSKRRAVLRNPDTGIQSNGRKGEPAPVLRDVLDAIRDWMLRRAEAQPVPLPRSVAAQASRMVGQLGRTAFGLAKLTSTPRVESSESVRTLGEIHPDLEPRYRLDRLELRLLTRVNSAGAIVLEPKKSKTWLQVDVQAKLHRDADMAELRHSLHLPDFLVAGSKYHRVFLEALREEGALAEIDQSMPGGGQDRLGALERFVRDEVAAEDVVIARIRAGEPTDRGQTVDLDLVALRERGRPGRWLVLLVAFRCTPYPDIEAEVDAVECLIGGEFGGEALEKKPPRVVADYLYRLLRVLTAWRVESGAAA